MTRRLTLLLAIFALAVLAAAAVMVMAEGRAPGDAIWWAIVTATTVGYGDIAPAGLAGRVAAAVLMLGTTMVLIPLLTAEIAAKLIVNSDAFTNAEQEEIKAALHRLEARMEERA